MIRRIEFEVPFVRGKGRVRFVRQTGRTYTPDATAQSMYDVRDAYLRAAGGASAPKGTPVRVWVQTWRPLPRSRPKRVEWEHDTFKPDADNQLKLILDALNGVAWADDTQVTDVELHKHARTRAADERTLVCVEWPVGGGRPDGEL